MRFIFYAIYLGITYWVCKSPVLPPPEYSKSCSNCFLQHLQLEIKKDTCIMCKDENHWISDSNLEAIYLLDGAKYKNTRKGEATRLNQGNLITYISNLKTTKGAYQHEKKI